MDKLVDRVIVRKLMVGGSPSVWSKAHTLVQAFATQCRINWLCLLLNLTLLSFPFSSLYWIMCLFLRWLNMFISTVVSSLMYDWLVSHLWRRSFSCTACSSTASSWHQIIYSFLPWDQQWSLYNVSCPLMLDDFMYDF